MEYRKLQGTYPVIGLSFANIKEKDYHTTRDKICQLLVNLYAEHAFLRESDVLGEREKEFFDSVRTGMGDVEATLALYQLSDFLYRYYGKKVLILLDEYDTPMQEAYVDGYWDELVAFTRSLFNAAFKTNPWLERAVMTGITRVSMASCEATESIFSDLNNLKVVTTTSDEYATGKKASGEEPERFYHGFVLGLMVELKNRYVITSNRESGFGRYDAMMEPRDPKTDAGIIMEFKVHDPEEEDSLKDMVKEALAQIEERKYEAILSEHGVPQSRIRKYGFTFQGKKVLIGKDTV